MASNGVSLTCYKNNAYTGQKQVRVKKKLIFDEKELFFIYTLNAH
jgi:hypothetical protein